AQAPAVADAVTTIPSDSRRNRVLVMVSLTRCSYMSSSRRHASPAQTPVGWLGKDAQGARVLGTAQLLLSVQEAVRATLPPAMAGFCHVARIEGQQITLAVP